MNFAKFLRTPFLQEISGRLPLMRVIVTVFLFLARARFSKSKSIAEVNRARYKENTVQRIWKFQKLNYCLRKAELDLEFLCKCDNKNVVRRFLDFGIASNHLKYSSSGGSRTAATFKMEHFVIIVNSWEPLTIITKSSILDVAAVLDPPLLQAKSIKFIERRNSLEKMCNTKYTE